MVKPWLSAGFRCVTVDLQATRAEPHERNLHLIADLRTWRPPDGALVGAVFGFPPCTDLAVSGSRWFERKRQADPLFQEKAAQLFDRVFEIAELVGADFAVAENPVSVLSSMRRRPDFTFDPCDFAGYSPDPDANRYTKKTCLWSSGAFTMPDPLPMTPIDTRIHTMSPGPERAYLRSLTPDGFAQAVFEANVATVRGLKCQR